MLIAARFVQAIGACSGVVLARAVVRDVYGRERAAKAFAYIGAAMALAPTALVWRKRLRVSVMAIS